MKIIPSYFVDKISILLVMVVVFISTLYFSANTYEVVYGMDLPGVDNIQPYPLTDNYELSLGLSKQLVSNYDKGSFGLPLKIRFPENPRHILVKPAEYKDVWLSRKGVAQGLLTADQRQKAFGEYVIYMRINTATIHSLGEFFYGDAINVTTDQGWQLGYSVIQVAGDISELRRDNSKSTIIVSLHDPKTEYNSAFIAELSVVGDRIK